MYIDDDVHKIRNSILAFGIEKKTNTAPIVLTEDQQRTFDPLKLQLLCSNSFVFQQGLQTVVETDASYSSGLGGVLSQEQNESVVSLNMLHVP
ncbi:hypothetical protein HNY73_021728 [Argiope bruennichi]|uniref:Uncharacterized protein n=1 Tax=Argiope bruennichi TaxID=94029 RepID=A0A8T0E0S7_ARGBR|nr:hypothetical protein HNY73_021728 [Argiope bruennichi]